MLDAAGSAYVRCAVTTGDELVYSDPVCVTISFVENAPVQPEEVPMILLTDLYVIEEEPTEATEAAEETFPAEVPTEAATAPSEEPTEPTPEDETTAPTEVPTEETTAEETTPSTGESAAPTEETTAPSESEPLMAGFLSLFTLEASATEAEEAQASESTEAAKEYVTITIKYLDDSSLEDGAEEHAVYSPYTAIIEKGTAFHQTVISPTYLGFAPYWDSNSGGAVGEDASQLSIALDSVTEDVTYNVYYKPINVNFAVRYFFQNINNDLYTENVGLYRTDKTKTGTIIMDDYLKKYAGDTTGFVKMFHKPESVAADGSTVFECYYDRNYYLLQFDLNGGYGVDPIYARYGTPFVVNEPVRHGYVFAGWDLLYDTNGDGTPDTGDGKADTLPASIPAANQHYIALWETVETTATVVYWLEDADIEGKYNYWGSYGITAKSGSTLYAANYQDISPIANELDTREMRYSVFNAEKTTQEVIVKGDGSSVVNVYYDRKEYTLKFYYAMSSGSGDDITYYIIGGSTYRFGSTATISDTGDEIKLLDHYMSNYTSQRGTVDELPTLNANGAARSYKMGTDSSTVNGVDYTYYYISFTDKYGADISEIWPCNVFNSVTRTDKQNTNGWEGSEAFVSAWNGEHHVYYSQHNTNETIKGNYMNLDYQLLWDYDQFKDSSTVAYLCFWENGANVNWNIPEWYRYNIYVPLLSGQDTTDLVLRDYNGVSYYQLATYDTCDNSTSSEQTAPAIIGYTYTGTYEAVTITDYDKNLYSWAEDVNFYYTRNEYPLTFQSKGSIVSDHSGMVLFGTALDGYHFEPEYPDTLEPNAYYFAGWYTTEDCFPGSEFGNFHYDSEGKYQSSDFEGCTMPASPMLLYANWLPKTHTVNFFNSYADMQAYEAGSTDVEIYQAFTNITHSSVVGSVEGPTVDELVFSGWFYIENGAKKAFSPLNMPINRDMNVYADWTSSTPQPYRIEHRLKDDPDTRVADDSEGYAYNGSTRTFTAKAGAPYDQLYEEYNIGYFPTVNSHSIVMQYEGTNVLPAAAQKNTYTFYYVKADAITYTVRYVDKETNLDLAPKQTYETLSSVVTERFLSIPNYVPDAFYKRLVLSVVWDEVKHTYVGSEDNEIIFYYTPNKTSAYYAVHFMLEKENCTDEQRENYALDGSGGYEETGTIIEDIGTIGDHIPITPQEFSGFALIEDQAVEVDLIDGSYQYTPHENLTSEGVYEIEVTANGTELYLFYSRLAYPYTVHYYLYNTNTSLKDSKYVVGHSYGSTVTEEAAEIEGYTCVSAQTKTITIREETDTNSDGAIVQDEILHNIIIFYYAPTQYTVEYAAVPADGGQLTRTIEVKTGDQAFEGSTASANQYYYFEGWYLDEACTQSAKDSGKANISEDGRTLVPVKSEMDAYGRNIFYAKFVRNAGDLTITRSNVTEDVNQVFVYEVKNTETGEAIYVTIVGNGSVIIHDLPFGKYTVTQQSGWSWRYNDSAQTISHADTGTTVQFTKDHITEQWLNGHSPLIVNRKKEGS